MDTSNLLVALSLMFAASFVMGRARSVSVAERDGGLRNLNSLPFYHGVLSGLWCAIPSLILTLVWLLFDSKIIEVLVLADLSSTGETAGIDVNLLMNTIENIAEGKFLGLEPHAELLAAAERFKSLQAISKMCMSATALSLGALGSLWILKNITVEFGARIKVEKIFKLILASKNYHILPL